MANAYVFDDKGPEELGHGAVQGRLTREALEPLDFAPQALSNPLSVFCLLTCFLQIGPPQRWQDQD